MKFMPRLKIISKCSILSKLNCNPMKQGVTPEGQIFRGLEDKRWKTNFYFYQHKGQK